MCLRTAERAAAVARLHGAAADGGGGHRLGPRPLARARRRCRPPIGLPRAGGVRHAGHVQGGVGTGRGLVYTSECQ